MNDTAESKRAFEDFSPGEAALLGSVDVQPADMIAFAELYDPQPFHLDAEAGAASPLGGLAASGWYTAGLAMRLLAEGLLNRSLSMGSGGVTDLKWVRPVLGGDRLTAGYEVLATRPSTSRRDRGYVDIALSVDNQNGERVFSYFCSVIMGRRPADAA
ncbi:MaoC family dehydratase [Methylobrevis pamukkalensis]|uniref:MaoC like domain protein n=1 Tax=Methylobrevis pamukkalensis TaxID=1439726 RepID=A0A1E3H5I8_9HYPH|nr:MaoC family dehydratase [Methylobrevis pamukkalensis]ODN71570.1 MaoC like domain protein [Methylobrevis pamukkalensis]